MPVANVQSTGNPESPLDATRAALLARLTADLDGASLYWISGYVAALAAHSERGATIPTAVAAPASTSRLTVVYGSQTGNAQRIATRIAQRAEADGTPVRLLRADVYPLRELSREVALVVVISTQGDGEPPDDAREFAERLQGARSPGLPQLRYAVLALGDSSYPRFCEIGKRVDMRLAELGAQRVHERGDCDLDIDTVAVPWIDKVVQRLHNILHVEGASATVIPLRPVRVADPSADHDREHPFAARVLLNQRITGRDATRDVRHVELTLEGSGLDYRPGDALGVWPRNPEALITAVLHTLALDGETVVEHGGRRLTLREWLATKRELTRLTRPFVAAHAKRCGDTGLQALLAPERNADYARLMTTQQPIDILQRWPARWAAEDLVAVLRPLAPRLYSIASSKAVVGEEAHLTVAVVDYEASGFRHFGAASDFIARTREGATLPVFIEHHERFRLPEDNQRDIVMIGPGVGVAPFRGFIQERAAASASGRSWLFFGARHSDSEFLYQTEWQRALRDGALARLDVAFSRDQAEKIYVQRRLLERARELYEWIEGGACIYLCGDARYMAADVHAVLHRIGVEYGGKSDEQARGWLIDLQAQGRYRRDVY